MLTGDGNNLTTKVLVPSLTLRVFAGLEINEEKSPCFSVKNVYLTASLLSCYDPKFD